MKKIVFLGLGLSVAAAHGMNSAEIEELSNVCITMLNPNQIRVIAAYARKLKSSPGDLELVYSSAKVLINSRAQNISIHQITFPQLVAPNPTIVLTLDEMLRINEHLNISSKVPK